MLWRGDLSISRKAFATLGLLALLGFTTTFLLSLNKNLDVYASPPPSSNRRPANSPSWTHSSHTDESSEDYLKDGWSGSSFEDGESPAQLRLSPNDFASWPRGELDSESDRGRYETSETWRGKAYLPDYAEQNVIERPKVPPINRYESKGHYLQQVIPADYAEGAEKVFFMIKTGSNILWKRLPVHVFTTLTRVPYFGLYADGANSIAGIEVIDIFQNLTQETLNSEDFGMYRKMRELHLSHGQLDASQIDLEKGWDLDKFKNLPMLYHAWKKSPHSEWFIFIDADSYIMIDTLLAVLKTMNHKDKIYYGSPAVLAGITFAHGGSGVVLSQGAMKAAFDHADVEKYLAFYEQETFNYCCGDYMVARYLDDVANIQLQHAGGVIQGNPVWDIYFHKSRWCTRLASFHHVIPHDVEIMWEYEKLRGPHRHNITYSDVYRDFIQPYLVEELEDWDNGSDAHIFDENLYSMDKFEKEGDKTIHPHESKEMCKQACHEVEECLGWRYTPEGKYCGLSKDIRLGRLAKPWTPRNSSPKSTKTFSGWNIGRIREARKKERCDILYDSPDDEGFPDGSENDRNEGWFYRYLRDENSTTDDEAKKEAVEKVRPPGAKNHEG